eukprot:1058735-Heterocapsa_arctica.AAC.1
MEVPLYVLIQVSLPVSTTGFRVGVSLLLFFAVHILLWVWTLPWDGEEVRDWMGYDLSPSMKVFRPNRATSASSLMDPLPLSSLSHSAALGLVGLADGRE